METLPKTKQYGISDLSAEESQIRFESIDGKEAVFYCLFCVDPSLREEIKIYERDPNFEVFDLTCNDCESKMEAESEQRYTKRASYGRLIGSEKALKIRDHFTMRLGHLLADI